MDLTQENRDLAKTWQFSQVVCSEIGQIAANDHFIYSKDTVIIRCAGYRLMIGLGKISLRVTVIALPTTPLAAETDCFFLLQALAHYSTGLSRRA
jgi:hypothetical protein